MAQLVSIIVPVYNTGPYLKCCIDSIINQTFSDFELIVVNDGSTDNSGKICADYEERDDRVKVIHKQNGGLSSARNAGIDVAKGSFICFVDSDDYIAPRMIEVLYQLINQYNCEISECGYYDVKFNKKIEKCKIGKGIEYGSGTFLLDKFLNNDLFNGVVTKMFRRRMFENVRFPIGRIFEEIYMTLFFCLDSTSYVRTEEPLYYYVCRENSILQTALTPSKAREYIYILDNMLLLVSNKVKDQSNKNTIKKKIIERNALSYLALALSENKKVRIIYSKLYAKKLRYSIIECIFSRNILYRNKISYIICRLNLGESLFWIKKWKICN